MSQFFQSFSVEDLALGKPPLFWLPSHETVKSSIHALRELCLSEVSIWEECTNSSHHESCTTCKCLGAINTLDIVCFLSEKTKNLEAALLEPISSILANKNCSVRKLDLKTRLTTVLEIAVGGVNFMLVPLPSSMKRSFGNQSPWPRKDFCWISQEVVTRFMMSCISAFCPQSLFSIEELGIIRSDFLFLPADARAISGIDLFRKASENMTAVALIHHVLSSCVADEETSSSGGEKLKKMRLVGDISPSTLRTCDENLTAIAMATLSAGDFLSCILDSKRGSQHFLKSIKARILQNLASADNNVNLESLVLSELESSDSEHEAPASSFHPRNSTCLKCKPSSSLVAVMAQALAHRSSYIWVTDADNMLVGMVTYADILGVLVKKLHSDKGRLGSSQKLFSSTPKLLAPPKLNV